MTAPEAILLGLVQGVTEFLPISSTAHLRIVPALAGWTDPGAAFTAVLQLGTLVAVIGFFLRELTGMLGAALRAVRDPASRKSHEVLQLVNLIVGTIPIGVAGILLKHHVEGSFRSLWVISAALVIVALLLVWVERAVLRERSYESVSLRDALLIGVAQAFALVPGVSRSGVTLLAAMALGFRRDAAARFSFLLSIPAVAAAGVFELPKVLAAKDIGAMPLVLGLVVAAISGYASIAWLLRFLRTRTTMPFVVYRILLGLALLGLVASGRVQ